MSRTHPGHQPSPFGLYFLLFPSVSHQFKKYWFSSNLGQVSGVACFEIPKRCSQTQRKRANDHNIVSAEMGRQGSSPPATWPWLFCDTGGGCCKETPQLPCGQERPALLPAMPLPRSPLLCRSSSSGLAHLLGEDLSWSGSHILGNCLPGGSLMAPLILLRPHS